MRQKTLPALSNKTSASKRSGLAQAACPFTVAIDTREGLPYSFRSIRADAIQGGEIMLVETEVKTLKSGDYSIVGFEREVACERKSLADCFGTIGTSNRDRFERELARLAEYQFAAVVVEAEWSEILSNPPPHTQVQPKTIFRSVLAWQQRYPRVHWHFMPGREAGEQVTYRILERFWKEKHK